MTSGQKPLFRAFRDDHAILGKGFHDLSACLRGNDVAGARRVAARVNREAGPHIVFEEESFYPALAQLSGFDTDRLFGEHGEGLDVVRTLVEMEEGDALSEDQRTELLAKSEEMEDHIAECGELFEAIAKLSDAQQESLYEDLVAWRQKEPTWLDYHRDRTRTGGG
jgi:hypothetical protein